MKYFLIILLFFPLVTFAHKDTSNVVYKIYLKDGGVFNGSTHNRIVYLVTGFAVLKINLRDIDSVDIGIMPNYSEEKRLIKLLKKLNTEKEKNAYRKIISKDIGAIPIIKNYLDNYKPNPENISDTLKASNVLKFLIQKYKVQPDYIDRDVVYMQDKFKIGGILSVKKKRALIRFGIFTFPRKDINKIVFIHKKKG